MTQATLDPFRAWHEFPLACFDLETTGPEPRADRVVTAYVATIDLDEPPEKRVSGHSWLLDPGIDISEGATKVHGISTEKAKAEGADYEEGVLAIWTALQLEWGDGRIVAGFNLAFDITMMTCELNRLGHKVTRVDVGPIVDPFILDKTYDKFRRGSRKLADVIAHYGLSIGDAHHADADAIAAARLAWKLPRVYADLARMTTKELQEAQEKWYRQQAESLREYRKNKGQSYEGIATSWPIQEAA